MSCHCLVFVWIFRKIVSGVCLLSGFKNKKLSVVWLFDRKRTRQSCPDFDCPCPTTSDLDIGTYRELLNLVFRRVEHYQDWIRIEHFLLLRTLGLIYRRGRFHRNDFRLRLFCNDELVAHDLKIEIFLEVVDNTDYGSRITTELSWPADPWLNWILRNFKILILRPKLSFLRKNQKTYY